MGWGPTLTPEGRRKVVHEPTMPRRGLGAKKPLKLSAQKHRGVGFFFFKPTI
jgi:hypothetical protein